MSHGASSLSGPGILHNRRVLDFEAALKWVMKEVVIVDREVLSRMSPSQNLNAAMIRLVEALHC